MIRWLRRRQLGWVDSASTMLEVIYDRPARGSLSRLIGRLLTMVAKAGLRDRRHWYGDRRNMAVSSNAKESATFFCFVKVPNVKAVPGS